ncbi:hypothetical protein K466DRAFT_604921 [Polyporus arcularius HHB13444]|uniref:Uncharacterized protein n=1 Tax=Polyporus arcularius HHB13444 TaxID=1314778 RepID=A0A5C3P571_9APHY|nr:hypothetical protein K466DRAFT_604921 [Polyporus arcularius HHB13444]
MAVWVYEYFVSFGLGACQAIFVMTFIISLLVVLSPKRSPFISRSIPMSSWAVLNSASFAGAILAIVGETTAILPTAAVRKGQYVIFLLQLLAASNLAGLRVLCLYETRTTAMCMTSLLTCYFLLVCATMAIAVGVGSHRRLSVLLTETVVGVGLAINFTASGMITRKICRAVLITGLRAQAVRAMLVLAFSASLHGSSSAWVAVAVANCQDQPDLEMALRYANCILPVSANILIGHLALRLQEECFELSEIRSSQQSGSIEFGSNSVLTSNAEC